MRPRFLPFVLVCAAALASSAGAAAYPWPVKPFNKQHPVRANFGDPRTIFQLSLFQNGMEGPGLFLFHNGIDIVAPDGTDVYPVVSGTAVLLDAETVAVQTPEGRVFQYFHIIPLVGDGEQVVAQKTVLGYIKHGASHVHLTEIRGFKVWNPLARGGIAPYRDTTRPTVAEVVFRRWNSLQDLDPLGICNQISIVADAFDTPPITVKGTFAAFPVAPAVVSWSLRRVGTGRVVVPSTTVVDFRQTLPLPPDFWSVYARGTYQNAPRFGTRQYDLMPGRFLYNLTPPDGLDTRTLPNGVYQVTVRVADIRGNSATLSRRFTIVNQGGSEAGCPRTP